MQSEEIRALRAQHVSTVLHLSGEHYQSFCACGWSSTIHELEHVDLLRAMHVHAMVTFEAYA